MEKKSMLLTTAYRIVYKTFSFSIVLLLLYSFSSAQVTRKKFIGMNVSGNLYSKTFRLSPGMSFENQLGKRTSLETGIYYLTKPDAVIIVTTSANGSTYKNLPVLQKHLYAPFLFKFYTKIINLSAGPTVEINTSWKQLGSEPMVGGIIGIPNKVSVGYLVKAGKDIRLGRQLSMEPEMLIGSIVRFNNFRFAIGTGLKYNL
jgi:hypothetical protein